VKKFFILAAVLGLAFLFTLSCKPKAGTKPAEPETAAAETASTPAELPAAVAEVVQKYFPGAEVENLETEKVDSVTLYDIEFKANQGEMEVAEDGTIIDISKVISWEEVPQAAAEAIKKAAESSGAAVARLEKAEVRAEIRAQEGRNIIFKLEAPVWLYEAELVRGEERGEIQVDAEGKIMEGLKWEIKTK
jgi:hypothetical protein